jgi:hypothetical protein
MKRKLLTALLLTVTTAALADSVIVTETKDWTSVPVTVDSTAGTYTVVEGTTVPTTNFYYTYPGYRCFKEKRTVEGVDPVTFRATKEGGEIYCYAE